METPQAVGSDFLQARKTIVSSGACQVLLLHRHTGTSLPKSSASVSLNTSQPLDLAVRTSLCMACGPTTRKVTVLAKGALGPRTVMTHLQTYHLSVTVLLI